MNLGPVDGPVCLSCGASPDRHQPDCASWPTEVCTCGHLRVDHDPDDGCGACAMAMRHFRHDYQSEGRVRALAAATAATVSVLTGHTGGCTCKECETLAYIRLPEVVGRLAEAEGRVRALIAHVDSGIVSVAALRHALDGTPMPDGPDDTDAIAARISRMGGRS